MIQFIGLRTCHDISRPVGDDFVQPLMGINMGDGIFLKNNTMCDNYAIWHGKRWRERGRERNSMLELGWIVSQMVGEWDGLLHWLCFINIAIHPIQRFQLPFLGYQRLDSEQKAMPYQNQVELPCVFECGTKLRDNRAVIIWDHHRICRIAHANNL